VLGTVFHRLTVVAEAEPAGRKKRWRCACSCGGSTVAFQWSLRAGRSRSCGCLAAEGAASIATELNARLGNEDHQMYGTPEYAEWLRMKSRCYYPSNRAFKKYGGSGVKVCDEWKDSFSAFLADMGPKPSMFHSIRRIGDRGDFSPSNCVWELNRDRQRRALASEGGRID
jgi:hypothetical protein